ncbi:Uncharacterized protein DAT39_004223 [Clarias magur]|uniref:Uncharacterized protein n=1 Tax=Clarias magur TaxID=1594786 RepID=A0A8J4X8V3_CLAMG|nr:Uncharacterized protein DAT39_004223 [Clarias magur]
MRVSRPCSQTLEASVSQSDGERRQERHSRTECIKVYKTITRRTGIVRGRGCPC